ncbi:cytochrome P450 [Irpex rosettiformis]|uniref:Cytochrome P450 n=1 Tax=Irpex rosettiformis TaxID=378272 RepID=A0ACB8TUZ7_9APHY|nr:cytochrome P450 [Irpex rosettiformis]
MSQVIPTPPSIPFIGHAASIEKELPLHSLILLTKQYGDIFQLNMIGTKVVHISTQKLLHEVSDEKRFRKTISTTAWEVRNATGDGLFTADVPREQNWFIAHRILMPAFSALNVRGMFDDMLDVTLQLTTKWERFGPQYKLDPSQDFTALTFEAITLCAMSYRMNSFYIDGLHPFARAMADFLTESGSRSMRPSIVQGMMRTTNAKYEADKNVMLNYVNDILQERKANPKDKKDILYLMMTGKDKETGVGMTDESIKLNMLTFLIAGHETTSGLLSFVLYHLLKNPEAMRKLRDEVDTNIGQRQMTVDDVNKLPYLIAVLRETLRLSSPVPMRAATPLEDTTLDGGKYAVEKDSTKIWCNVYQIHRDPAIWGPDAEEFKPERMLDGKFEALPPDSWQPFGFGMRGCIGRPFAWQEAQMVIVHIIQRFDIVMDDPTYDLKLKQTLTIKPKDFYIHAIPRKDKAAVVATPSSTLLRDRSNQVSRPISIADSETRKPLYVLYGSNTGNSEAFAQRITSEAGAHGFRASIGALDSVIDHLPKDGPVIIVTASFEGQPADNAAHFVEWISSLSANELTGVSYAVFGCGNKDWVATYQRIPTLIDDVISKRGGMRFVARGEGDAGSGEFFDAFDTWVDGLWKTLAEHYGVTLAGNVASTGIEIKTLDIGTTRATVLRQPDAALGTCVVNRVLTAPGVPEKRHLEFDLPEDTGYHAGDYLAILPVNPSRDVSRTLARFNLSGEQEVTITSSGPSPLPTNRPVSVLSLLSGYVELSQPATMRDLRTLAELAESGSPAQAALKALTESELYATKVLTPRLSLLDILEIHKDLGVPFSTFLGLLPSMRVRQYSISSSPLANPSRATLTVSILSSPRPTGNQDLEPFLGVASTYLASLRPGDKVQLAVRPSAKAFHPPSDLTIPLIMLCAGSGLAPMRGFLEERAIQKQAGRGVATCVLFFGCRSPGYDYLYGEQELKVWEEAGVVDVRPAFSRDAEKSEGCNYIQDRLWKDREVVINAWGKGSKIYVCGSGRVAAGVKETLVKIIQDHRNVDLEAATAIFNDVIHGRFATDVFE